MGYASLVGKMEAKNFDYLIGKVEGISEKQLRQHFGLYQGYVKKLNEIREKLKNANKKTANYSFGEFSELKRREAVAYNGVYLHELYFENLSNSGDPSKELRKAVIGSFETWEDFEEDLRGSAASTPGWVLVTFDRNDKKLHTYILFEHHIGLPVNQEIIIALDCWEHAFMIDYGTDKVSYLNVFMKNINWDITNKRFKQAVGGKNGN